MDSAHPKSTARSSEAVYRALLESATDLIVAVVDGDMNVRFVNAAVRSTLGWMPEDLVGKRSLDFVHPEDRELAARTLADAAASNEPTPPTLLRARHYDGTWVYLEVVGHSRLSDPEIEGVLVHGRDVTERMRGAARLQQSETRLREIFECVHDGLFLVDVATARVVDANLALCALFGYDRHDLVACDVRTLLPDAGVWERAASTPEGERRALDGVAVRRKDGGLRHSDIAVTTFAQPGSASIVVAVVRDVTERRAAERMKELFFAVVAHELRSPVAVLKSSMSLLRTRTQLRAEDREELLAIHEEEVARLAHIVADGLDFSAIHAGKLKVQPIPIALEPLVRSLVKRSALRGREVRIEAEALTALVDPGRFEQVVTNLLDNAWRHGGAAPNVSLRIAREGAFARVWVEDDGPGIPAPLREVLFDRYYLVSDRPTRGMGIGLWLSKRFVEAMGGSIAAEGNEAGARSCVWFTVPLDP